VFRSFFRSKKIILSAADQDFLHRLKNSFGIKPKNIDLFKIAVTHKSASSTTISNGKKVNNERLEYLGDSILDAIVADYLFTKFPDQNEGFLTKMRSRIVSRYSLNNIALAINLDKLVVTQTNNAIACKHIYGDALEAFVGALYLDVGFKTTRKWVNKFILIEHIDLNELQSTETDYKSRVIELAQKYKYSITFDSQERVTGKGQNPLFESKLFINKKLLGTGFGTSKKEAEQNASMVALERIDLISLPDQQVKPQTSNWEN
jgi:ribonuclease III